MLKVVILSARASNLIPCAQALFVNEPDPNNQFEDNYRHLAEIPGARHAPGPARFADWTE